jgi:hypothetical protein
VAVQQDAARERPAAQREGARAGRGGAEHGPAARGAGRGRATVIANEVGGGLLACSRPGSARSSPRCRPVSWRHGPADTPFR